MHLAPGESFVVGMVERPDRPVAFRHGHGSNPRQQVRGIATSGWRGRSFSLGIADAVTVLAESAAMADAAATVIANALDLPGHGSITRVRACDPDPHSDLGERLVTQSVGDLSECDISTALEAGTCCRPVASIGQAYSSGCFVLVRNYPRRGRTVGNAVNWQPVFSSIEQESYSCLRSIFA